MKVGLIDVDSHNFPNLALMKISAFHKARDDSVGWWLGLDNYDLVYKSKIFTEDYTHDEPHCIQADQVIYGGTGYNIKLKLPPEIESQYPDYSIYPNINAGYGYLTRGCPRQCPFCIVGNKEGFRSTLVAELNDFWNGQPEIRLLDPNILACPEHERLLVNLAASKATIDFTQGLDIRLITDDNAQLLLQLKAKTFHFAWDNPNEDLIEKFRKWKALYGRDCKKQVVYVLTNFNTSHEEDLWRVGILRNLGYSPYIMIYNKPSAPHRTRLLQRWVNNRYFFWGIASFADFIKKHTRM